MKPLSFNQLKQRAGDRFVYIFLGCPNFPPATGTTTKTAFEKLIGFIDGIVAQLKDEEVKQWLRICLLEINDSWKSYDKGDIKEGKRLILKAKEHFDNAFSKKPITARSVGERSDQLLDKKLDRN